MTDRSEESVGTVVHLLLSAEPETWRQCRRLCKGSDRVVLVAAAVRAPARPELFQARDFPCEVSVLDTDTVALGYVQAARVAGIEMISIADLVDLTAAHPNVLSWK